MTRVKQVRSPHKTYTKEEIRTVAAMWERQTKEEIADLLGRSKSSVSYMAQKIRKLGYQLPRAKRARVNSTLIHDALAESGLVFLPRGEERK